MNESSKPPPDEIRTVPPVENNATGAYVTVDDDTRTVPPRETVTSAPAIPDLPPGYEFLRELGRGGMGVVYQARDTKLNRIVALKMILAGSHASQSEMQRFLKEAEAVAAQQHPNIVQIFEIGQHHGLPFFTLEFVEDGTLAAKVREQPLPPKQAARLVEQLAHGMAYAHGKGIVHRDLKPENVLLAADGTPKITDFGLAKRIQARTDGVAAGLTETGAVMGTPSYMAPEQAAGQKEIGPLADVYALGAILYRLLTGRPPFMAATQLDTILQVVSEEPTPISQLRPDVPRDLQVICLKCLQKKSSQRYLSAADLADDLERFLEDRPIKARRPGALENARRWARKRPDTTKLLKTLAAGAVCVFALWFAWAVYSSYRANQLYDELRLRPPPSLPWMGQYKSAEEKLAAMKEYREADRKLRELGRYDPVREERLRQEWGILRDGDGFRLHQQARVIIGNNPSSPKTTRNSK